MRHLKLFTVCPFGLLFLNYSTAKASSRGFFYYRFKEKCALKTFGILFSV